MDNYAHLRQRDPETGFPVGADAIMREACGQIPDQTVFQNQSYGYEKPLEVHGWQWNTTFNRWSALVTFADGWTGFTYPAPWRKHHDDCPFCGTRLTRHSPEGFNLIFECPATPVSHHRHMIMGVTGEYISMRPLQAATK